MKGEGSSEGGELTQQGARQGVEMQGDGKSHMWDSRSWLGGRIHRETLKFWEMLFLLLLQDFPSGGIPESNLG